MSNKLTTRFIYAGLMVVFFCTPVFAATIAAPAANSNQNRLVPTVKQPNIPNLSGVTGQVRMPSADLAVAISCPDSVDLRSNFGCYIKIINQGPQAIPRADLYIRDSGAKIISANWPGCNQSSGYMFCYRDGLKPGESAELKLTLIPVSNDTATIEVSARLNNAYDTNDANNTAARKMTIYKK
jgi:hypothetical protein